MSKSFLVSVSLKNTVISRIRDRQARCSKLKSSLMMQKKKMSMMKKGRKKKSLMKMLPRLCYSRDQWWVFLSLGLNNRRSKIKVTRTTESYSSQYYNLNRMIAFVLLAYEPSHKMEEDSSRTWILWHRHLSDPIVVIRAYYKKIMTLARLALPEQRNQDQVWWSVVQYYQSSSVHIV